MIKIEHWSDFRCPFCYICDAEVNATLKSLKDTSDIQFILKAFELDPEAPKHTEQSVAEVFANKYRINVEEAERKITMMNMYAQKVGIAGFNYKNSWPTNTFDAHRLTKYADAMNVPGMYDRLMKAYFVDNVNLSDPQVLLNIAVEMGLQRSETEAMLNSHRYADGVRLDEYEAYQMGIRSVPTYIFESGERFNGAGCAEQMKALILQKRELV